MAIEDTFIPVHYHVTISAAGLGGASPANGFIDHTTTPNYGTLPTALTNAEAKARGNIRYEEIISKLSETISPIRILNRTATGADHDTDATSFEMTLVYDRPEYVRIEDVDTPGTFLTGTAAIARMVSTALNFTYTKQREVYDPTLDAGITIGQKIVEITASQLHATLSTIEANVTVIESDLTT